MKAIRKGRDYGLPHSRWSFAMTTCYPVIASFSEAIQNNTIVSLEVEDYLYKKAVKEERSDGICLRYKYPKRKEKKYGLPRSPKRLPRNDKIAAFSLVEMLMALLVASLLLAALAPVMTRRFGETVNVSGVGRVIPKTTCIRFNDTDSILEFNDEETGCVVPDNTYSASAIIASGGGGGGAAYYIKENYTPEKQSDCEPFGVFVSSTNNGGSAVCVSKYNPDDIYFTPASTNLASPEIPQSVVVLPPDGVSTSTECASGNCCWKPQNYSQFTSNKCNVMGTSIITSGFNGMNYSGCHRTLCQFNAAQKICANWKPCGKGGYSGRLPREAELNTWTNNKILNAVSGKPGILNWTALSSTHGDGYGLQLCDNCNNGTSCNFGYSWCAHGDSVNCIGSLASHPSGAGKIVNVCMPHVVWGDNVTNLHINKGAAGVYNFVSTSAFSVRCVIEKVRKLTPYKGGGGSSGTFIGIEVPKEVIARALELGNARIDTIAGAGGAGGAKATAAGSNAKDGKNGNASKIAIYGGGGTTYNSGGTLLWSLEVPGGYGGTGATSNSDGEKGKALTNPECKYFDITSQNYGTNKSGHIVPCKDLPKNAYAAGKDGADNGEGGKSVWSDGTSTVYSDGKGGEGTSCSDEDTSIVCNAGENGAPGRIQALHIPTYPGVGGGGGGAGNVIHVVNFSVKKGDLIKVTVGQGGKGGAGFASGDGNNGSDGGMSFIELSNGTKYGVLGGKGGRGGKQGNPNQNIAPIPGTGGTAQGYIAGSAKVPSDYYFKGNDGQDAIAFPQTFENALTAAGGHGGINPKISGLSTKNETGGSNNNIPCGGLNTIKDITVNDNLSWIGAENCSANDNAPLALTRTLYDNVFNLDIIKDFALGATGGGGGGWAQGKSIPAQSGASGLGGYVYIYYGGWE